MNTFLPYTESLTWIIIGGGKGAVAKGPEKSTVYEFLSELGYPAGEATIIAIVTTVIPLLKILGALGMR